jgi:hypothetical protein
MMESDGIHEIFEHTLQVGTGILNEHGRGMAERRAAAAREQAALAHRGTVIADAQAAAGRTELGNDLAEAAEITALSNARPVADAVANPPWRSPTARRGRGAGQPGVERERGR